MSSVREVEMQKYLEERLAGAFLSRKLEGGVRRNCKPAVSVLKMNRDAKQPDRRGKHGMPRH